MYVNVLISTVLNMIHNLPKPGPDYTRQWNWLEIALDCWEAVSVSSFHQSSIHKMRRLMLKFREASGLASVVEKLMKRLFNSDELFALAGMYSH